MWIRRNSHVITFEFELFGTCQTFGSTYSKVGYQGINCAFSSYSVTSKACHFLNLEPLSSHTIIESIYANFFETNFQKEKVLKAGVD